MARSRRGRPVNTQMPSEHTLSTHATDRVAEQYDASPFAAHPHDVGTGGIPVKIFERHGEHLPADHPPGQTSAMSARGTPSHRTRRFGKAL